MTLAVPVPHSAPGALDKIATIEDVAAASKKDGDVRTAPDAGLRSLDHCTSLLKVFARPFLHGENSRVTSRKALEGVLV